MRAALGARVEIPTFDGPVKLRIPPGTASGQRLRVRDHGVGAPEVASSRGDLLVEIQIVLPAELDEASKALLRDFGRLNNADVRRQLFDRV